ncbi:MAG: YdcH family protein [Acidobacteriia bacterium]|jgi:uncharacterized protein YdcH (DUF465 family)|nr:YdcH family protein [Terriglobia bacterium]
MPVSPQDVREYLLASNEEFQKLAREHSEYERQLDQLAKQPYLNAEDLAREVALKKMKLRVKDRMQELIARHLQQY